MSDISEEAEERFQQHITQMKRCIQSTDIDKAICHAKSALKIRDSEKLRRRLKKMEDYLKQVQDTSAEEGEDMANLGNGFFIAKELYDRLYQYQREGISWMWNLFLKGKGGILGDDMGLGKTVQMISLISGLFDLQKIKTVLIIMPLTLISNWENEFKKWAPGIDIHDYQGLTKRQRERELGNIQRKGGVILATYGLMLNGFEQFSTFRGQTFVWDYVILDEGHKIKNQTKTTKAINGIPSKNRLVLTGTPIQNNLAELWSLYDFVHHGALLGTCTTFKLQFEKPILRSRQKDASSAEKRLGEKMSLLLRQRIDPYFLRRTKEGVLGQQVAEGCASAKVPKSLSQKNDFVIWILLTDEQIRVYQECLKSEMITEVLLTKKSPLTQLTILKKICDHIRLLSVNASHNLGLMEDIENYQNGDRMVAQTMLNRLSDSQLMEESGKLMFLMELLQKLRSEGHRCLVFSQSKIMLDIIEVGGVGLTLTAANRVVIYDPSWNPASDSQAVDRVYRIGQEQSVIVYRLITCGTVEERIYRRQVFKQSIHKQTVESKSDANLCRYFTHNELRDMFTLENPKCSTTQIQLEAMHASSRKTSVDLDGHIAFLYSLGIFGISDHDLLFTVNNETVEQIDEIGQRHIGDWMARTNKLVDMECELTDKARVEQGMYVKPVMAEDKILGFSRTNNARNITPAVEMAPASPKRPPLTAVNADICDMDVLVDEIKMLSPFKPWRNPSPKRSEWMSKSTVRDNHEDMDFENTEPTVLVSSDIHDTKRTIFRDLNEKTQIIDLSSPKSGSVKARESSTGTISKTTDVIMVSPETEFSIKRLRQLQENSPCDVIKGANASDAILEEPQVEKPLEQPSSPVILISDNDESIQSPHMFVDKVLDISKIPNDEPAVPFFRRGFLNSTRISEAQRRKRESSEDADDTDDGAYHSVDKEDSSNAEFQSFVSESTALRNKSMALSKAVLEDPLAIDLRTVSPAQGRIQASKLRRSSMHFKLARDIEDIESEDEESDKLSDASSEESGERANLTNKGDSEAELSGVVESDELSDATSEETDEHTDSTNEGESETDSGDDEISKPNTASLRKSSGYVEASKGTLQRRDSSVRLRKHGVSSPSAEFSGNAKNLVELDESEVGFLASDSDSQSERLEQSVKFDASSANNQSNVDQVEETDVDDNSPIIVKSTKKKYRRIVTYSDGDSD